MKVRCVMMQKNEVILLEPWLKWHGYLFGFENLTVIDNGSTRPEITDILEKYERVGVNIRRDFDKAADFVNKGSAVAQVARDMPAAEPDEILIPIDCDEFVALWREGKICTDRMKILAHFEELARIPGHYRVVTNLFNILGRPGWFWPQGAGKVIFRRRSFGGVDHGFHHGQSNPCSTETVSSIVYYHFHNKPHAEYVTSAWNKLLPFAPDTLNSETLKDWKGAGGHLRIGIEAASDRFRGSPAFQSDIALFVPGLNDRLTALGGGGILIAPVDRDRPTDHTIAPYRDGDVIESEAFEFRSMDYLKNWPDIDQAGADPLFHWIFMGRHESRNANFDDI